MVCKEEELRPSESDEDEGLFFFPFSLSLPDREACLYNYLLISLL